MNNVLRNDFLRNLTTYLLIKCNFSILLSVLSRSLVFYKLEDVEIVLLCSYCQRFLTLISNIYYFALLAQ